MTYDYICTACGHAWEAEQRISEAPLKDCPECNQQTAKRQVSGGAGFILKGGGWYADLYSSSSKSDSSKGESKSESKTETKKTEPAPAESPKTSSSDSSSGSKSSSTAAA
jgi:putative FmdB family regulatory protein